MGVVYESIEIIIQDLPGGFANNTRQQLWGRSTTDYAAGWGPRQSEFFLEHISMDGYMLKADGEIVVPDKLHAGISLVPGQPIVGIAGTVPDRLLQATSPDPNSSYAFDEHAAAVSQFWGANAILNYRRQLMMQPAVTYPICEFTMGFVVGNYTLVLPSGQVPESDAELHLIFALFGRDYSNNISR